MFHQVMACQSKNAKYYLTKGDFEKGFPSPLGLLFLSFFISTNKTVFVDSEQKVARGKTYK